MRYSLSLLYFLNSLFALEVDGREGKLLYTLQVPSQWEAISTPKEKIKDTMEPLITWRKGALEHALLFSSLWRIDTPRRASHTVVKEIFDTTFLRSLASLSRGVCRPYFSC